MDQKVKDAQVWVNKTYNSVSGYQECPETGQVGWSTMYSLTMGLQHELGIDSLVANFGPSTASKFAGLGQVKKGWKKNENIVRIIQHALFCKGYWSIGSAGIFDATTDSAVRKIELDMGLLAKGIVTVDICRCILNMDAYVVVAGGTEKIRQIQMWLNNRYWEKSEFSIGPCDGIYSRDVQKSLMTGLQYELGIPVPNGNFGPSTQANLRRQKLGPGSSGVLVQLFSAACVFNEPVPYTTDKGDVGTVRSNMTDSFNSKLAEYVQAFQQFSQIPLTGQADYATWAQLLVSMGDPDRPAAGCDTRFQITSTRAKWLRSNGYGIVGRYLYNPPTPAGWTDLDKDIKPGELETIFKAGLRVFPIYQDAGNGLEHFTYSNGYRDAARAHDRAQHYEFNKGTVIYFAVDYDATQEDIESAIIPYFNGVVSGLAAHGKKYVHGVYGSRNVCLNVTSKTYARFSFVSGMSWGFSGNLGYALPQNWSFNQIKESAVVNGTDSFDLDRDVWRGDGGDPGQSSVNKPANSLAEIVKQIQSLYNLAKNYPDKDPNALVTDFYRDSTYDGAAWNAALGFVDQKFIQAAEKAGIEKIREFPDPFSGYGIGTEHLFATIQGHFKIPQTAAATVNMGDISGWAGDLLTFYNDWKTNEETYASGYQFCMDRMAKPNVISSFGYTDLLEDADGYNIAKLVLDGKDILTALKSFYYGRGPSSRFTSFFNNRFKNASNAAGVTDILMFTDQPDILAARTYLGGANHPPTATPPSKLRDFNKGFIDTLIIRMGQEK